MDQLRARSDRGAVATCLRCSPDVEVPEPDEQAAVDDIIRAMTEQAGIVETHARHAVQASHAKSTACAVGTLTVAADLPPELAQGLFAQGGTHDVAVRFAQGPGETLGGRVSTHRALVITVFGVAGEPLAGHGAPIRDFVLATGPIFASGTARGFRRDGTPTAGAAALPEGTKSAVASLARNLNRALRAAGTESAMAGFHGHPFSHPFVDTYVSQAPVRWGDHVAKLGAFPASAAQEALRNRRLDPHRDEGGFRTASVAFLRAEEVVYELRAQLRVDAEAQLLADASVERPTSLSPYRTVGRIVLPRQEAHSEEHARSFDEALTLRSAHSLAAHRPLGVGMRVWLQVYRALSDHRHRATGIPEAHPCRIGQIPA